MQKNVLGAVRGRLYDSQMCFQQIPPSAISSGFQGALVSLSVRKSCFDIKARKLPAGCLAWYCSLCSFFVPITPVMTQPSHVRNVVELILPSGEDETYSHDLRLMPAQGLLINGLCVRLSSSYPLFSGLVQCEP